jgi:DNA-binding NtrC family response regulator
MRPTVLVVDDRERPRQALATELEDAGFDVVQASDGAQAWEIFRRSEPDAVVTDMVMPQSDGLELLGRIRSRSDVPVILFTAHGTVQAATTAFKRGADDFVSSPDVEIEDLVSIVTRAVAGAHDHEPASELERRLAGRSRAMQKLRERIAGLAPLRTPVLVAGEPGSGRDTVVTAIHELGATAGGELLRIDAASFSPGAGVRPAAAVYLDGIERLSPSGQAYWATAVARAEQRGFRDPPRILASTADPFTSRLREGDTFQELRGLLLRFALELPPMRVIGDDVAVVAQALVARLGAAVGRQVRLSPAARDFVATRRWPGNVRQLEKVMERAITFTRGRQIRRGLIEELLDESEESLASIRARRLSLERESLLRALQETGGNVSHAAERLGKSRPAVYRLIAKHGIPLARER